jgi:hypothetical protein
MDGLAAAPMIFNAKTKNRPVKAQIIYGLKAQAMRFQNL